VSQARNQGGRSGRTTPRLSAKGPLSQVKDSIRACYKIKISFRLTQEGKRRGKGREGKGREGGKEGEVKGEGMGRDGKGRKRGGPQFKKNDPPPRHQMAGYGPVSSTYLCNTVQYKNIQT